MFKRIESSLETMSAIAVVSLCLLIVANIVTREVFQFGVPDAIIIVRELMVVAILFPLAAATASRSHVSIEFIANKLPEGLNRAIGVLAALIGLLLVSVLLLAGWTELNKAISSGSHYGGDLRIPKWPSRAIFVAAMAMFWLRLLHVLIVDLKAAVTGQPAADEL